VERKIHDLTQDTLPTKSTAEYTTEFRNLISNLDWDDTAYLATYRRGLNWKVRELMSQRENQPTTLESWITIATQIGHVRRENEASHPPRSNTTLDMSGEKFLPGDSGLLQVENPMMQERAQAQEVTKPSEFSARNLRDTQHLSARIPGDSSCYSRTWKGGICSLNAQNVLHTGR
jgi:hypothetical protein